MASATTRSTSSHQSGFPELGVENVCCLLHNLIPGGSALQWVNLLGRHVEDGGRATVLAPRGPLVERLREAGIAFAEFDWRHGAVAEERRLREALDGHEAAVVHWDHIVMDAFETALRTCGRVAFTVHQLPDGLARWWGADIVDRVRVLLERAAAEPRATILVRGEWHRRHFVEAFGLPPEELRILPASIPLPPPPASAAAADGGDVLAMTRLSAEKWAIVGVGVEMTAAGLEAGRGTRLEIAGRGASRDEALFLCERSLPPSAWTIESPPADPLARLAAAGVVVAQGLTTLEAAALERRVVVARTLPDGGLSGTLLTPERYDAIAADPFARIPPGPAPAVLWEEALALGADDLAALRGMVRDRNGLDAASTALAEALAATA